MSRSKPYLGGARLTADIDFCLFTAISFYYFAICVLMFLVFSVLDIDLHMLSIK